MAGTGSVNVHALKTGDHVIARDAFNKLLAASIWPVPREWRSRYAPYNDVWTDLGQFPKVWLRLEATGHIIPWPIEDVFDDMDSATASQKEHADAE